MYPNQPDQQPQGYQPYPPNPQQPGINPSPYNPAQPFGPAAPQTPAANPFQTPQPQAWQQPAQTPPNPWAQPATVQPLPQQVVQSAPGGVSGIEYLDQIAPKTKQGLGGFSRKQVALFGGLLLLAFGTLAAVLLVNGSKPNIAALSQTAVAKTSALTEVSRQSQQNIKSGKLAAINSSLLIQLTGANTELTNAFAKAGVNTSKISKDIAASTSNATLLQKLDDARLNGTFDSVYSREMSYELTILLINLQSIYTTTNSASLKSYLENTYNNIQPLQKQLAAFNSGSGS